MLLDLKYIYITQCTVILFKDFSGNTDEDTIIFNELNPPIRARFIRFHPEAWYGHISMRVELYGCSGSVEYFSLTITNEKQRS